MMRYRALTLDRFSVEEAVPLLAALMTGLVFGLQALATVATRPIGVLLPATAAAAAQNLPQILP